ncbi:hypothetical protein [Streptomyces sp. NPDC029554]
MSSEQPDPTPRPNQILAEPATPQRCAEDYAQAADIRDRLGWHQQGERR